MKKRAKRMFYPIVTSTIPTKTLAKALRESGSLSGTFDGHNAATLSVAFPKQFVQGGEIVRYISEDSE